MAGAPAPAPAPDYRRGVDLLREPMWLAANDGWGTHRASFPPIESEAMVARLLRMPPGQRSPWHGSAGWPELGQPFPPIGDGCIFFVVEGEVDFVAGEVTCPMVDDDVLLINALVYSYLNPGLADVYFWTIQPKRGASGGDATPAAGVRVWDGDPAATKLVGSHPYYDEEPDRPADDVDRMRVVHWDDYRRSPIRWHGAWGSHWGEYPTVGSEVRGRMLRLPGGQHACLDGRRHEVLLLGTGHGPMEVRVGDHACPLGIRDAVLVPSGAPFELVGTGADDGLCLETWLSPDRLGTGAEPAADAAGQTGAGR